MQLESSSQAQTQSEVVLDAESGAEVLNESFLEIEAEQELKTIQKQEELLKAQEQTQENEKNKFIEIISKQDEEMFSEAQSLAQDEVELDKKQTQKAFKPNVFENYDAETGKKIEESEIKNEPKAQSDYEIDTDSLYSSFKPDADAGAYIAKLENNPVTAPVVEQVKAKEQQTLDQKKIVSEAESLMKSEIQSSEESKAISALKAFANPVMKDYDQGKSEKELLKQSIMGTDKPEAKSIGQAPVKAPLPVAETKEEMTPKSVPVKTPAPPVQAKKVAPVPPVLAKVVAPASPVLAKITAVNPTPVAQKPVPSAVSVQKPISEPKKVVTPANPVQNPVKSQKPTINTKTTPTFAKSVPLEAPAPIKKSASDTEPVAYPAKPIKASSAPTKTPTPAELPSQHETPPAIKKDQIPSEKQQSPYDDPQSVVKAKAEKPKFKRFEDYIDKLEKSKTNIKIDEPSQEKSKIEIKKNQPPKAPADAAKSSPKIIFDPSKGPLKAAPPQAIAKAVVAHSKQDTASPKILFDPAKAAPPKSNEAKNVKTVDTVKKQMESHINDQVQKADKENNKKETAIKLDKTEKQVKAEPKIVPLLKQKMKQIESREMTSEKNAPTQIGNENSNTGSKESKRRDQPNDLPKPVERKADKNDEAAQPKPDQKADVVKAKVLPSPPVPAKATVKPASEEESSNDEKSEASEKSPVGQGWSKKEAKLENEAKEAMEAKQEKKKPKRLEKIFDKILKTSPPKVIEDSDSKEKSVMNQSVQVDNNDKNKPRRLPDFVKEKFDPEKYGQESKTVVVSQQKVETKAKIPAQIGWAKLEAQQEKINGVKKAEVAKVQTVQQKQGEMKKTEVAKPVAFPAEPKKADQKAPVTVKPAEIKQQKSASTVNSAPVPKQESQTKANLLARDVSIPLPMGVQNVHPQVKIAQQDKDKKEKATTDNTHIKIDEKTAPQATDDKIGLTVFQNLLGQDKKVEKTQQQKQSTQEQLNSVLQMIDKSKNEISEIQTIHDQLIEQNHDLMMESDGDMPPVTIEKVQIQQENTGSPKVENNITEQKQEAPAEKTSDPKKPEESGFKGFMRKWFKITW